MLLDVEWLQVVVVLGVVKVDGFVAEGVAQGIIVVLCHIARD